jgi:hypothetical protein
MAKNAPDGVAADDAKKFAAKLDPIEGPHRLVFLKDGRTGANYCECHIRGSTLVKLGTVDVPLDPDEQSEYRANRELVEGSYAFQRMKEDAKESRGFSNIVAEYDPESEIPIKIIGGQHRFTAISYAFDHGIDEYHGIKFYFGLSKDQRLDVQLISNTNIQVSTDLYDRMQETFRGPELRNWCQKVGLLSKGEDFADKRERGGPISVQVAKTFISNYYRGKSTNPKLFDGIDTTPQISPTGVDDPDWDKLRKAHPKLLDDAGLTKAATQFSRLAQAQRTAFANRKPKAAPDYPEKAMNMAVISAWSFIAGMLHENPKRLKNHFELADTQQRDPLNALELSKGRHKTDPENYRGLGYRTDAKERGRFVELFADQAENGEGITKARIDVAIKKYYLKQAQIDVFKAQGKGE